MGVQQFKKKPVVIEALQLSWDTWNEMCDFVGVGKLEDNQPEGCYVNKEGFSTKSNTDVIGLHIPTLEGVMLATQNDWVIKGIQGEFYPCKPDIFEASYELA